MKKTVHALLAAALLIAVPFTGASAAKEPKLQFTIQEIATANRIALRTSLRIARAQLRVDRLSNLPFNPRREALIGRLKSVITTNQAILTDVYAQLKVIYKDLGISPS